MKGGSTMVDLPSRPLADIDPEFEKIALETGALTYALPGTTVREKLLQCVADDICRGHLGLALRLHAQAALAHGTPFATLLAAVRFIAPYAGYPAAADALARIATTGAELGVDLAVVPASAEGHSALAESGSQADSEPDTTDPWLADFIASRTGRAWTESGLSPRERAYLALTADVAQQTLGGAFRRHVDLARESGASPEAIRDVLRFTAEFGIANAAAALRELDAILPADGAATAAQ
jgi:4-carboxymuconolactone decarboxylase